jgi:hypothetical protein
MKLMSARPLLTHVEIGADLGNRGYRSDSHRSDSHQCSNQRTFDCGETGTIIDEIL